MVEPSEAAWQQLVDELSAFIGWNDETKVEEVSAS
jgi:hypothetical protein